jgi:alpha-D-ribose 1-methylphosphonate 5-triphosphate synthase subunit PhnI
MSQFRASEIAEIIGKDPKTIANHRKSEKLIMNKDDDGYWVAEAYEIERSYKRKFPDIGERIMRFVNKSTANENDKKEVAQEIAVAPASVEQNLIKDLLAAQQKLHEAELDRLQNAHKEAMALAFSSTKLIENHASETKEDLLARETAREAVKLEAKKNKSGWKKLLGL